MSVHVTEGHFQQDFFDYVEELAFQCSFDQGRIGDNEMDTTVRQSKIKTFEDAAISNELFAIASKANADFYGYDMWNISQLQYAVYEGQNADHFDWHIDTDMENTAPSVRKMSISVQLSDADEYEGGDIEFRGASLPPSVREKGTVITFPSWQLHRVTPVTHGVRKSLVAWFMGPRWR